jgi:hypothetical protein
MAADIRAKPQRRKKFFASFARSSFARDFFSSGF